VILIRQIVIASVSYGDKYNTNFSSRDSIQIEIIQKNKRKINGA